jgi:hypothetical protein
VQLLTDAGIHAVFGPGVSTQAIADLIHNAVGDPTPA